ncbi:hypothetical protein NIES2100_19220 [Calothrix sp. NIES-2100]|nr:hypothetical protein NIES2100_19220 [Calothrix sp. NIES-2100]
METDSTQTRLYTDSINYRTYAQVTEKQTAPGRRVHGEIRV